ncbi:MAG: hypothetical protein ABIR71_13315 [Chthoniobacterales bacterium]
MNDFSDLETELKQLRPSRPSDELALWVEQALTASTPSAGILPRRKTSRFNWFSLGLGVATAAAAFLFLARPAVDRPTAPQPTIAQSTATPAMLTPQPPRRTLVPDGVTRVVYGTRDEGLVFPGNREQPMRRLRARSQETLQWRDSSTGASLRVSYPTEEVELIPAVGQ